MKIDNSLINIEKFIIHYTGNKLRDEGIVFSKNITSTNNKNIEHLLKYFIGSFKFDELFSFQHIIELQMNELYPIISNIFNNNSNFIYETENISKLLYEYSMHPRIKGGEFYVAYFNNCIINGKTVDAVGLFKSENKDTFLKVYPSGDGFEIESQQGVNINKLDKGCLIFNTEREKGYLVAVIDNTNKGAEAKYWTEDFLNVRPRQDEYYNTQNVLTLCKNFVTKELPNEFDVSKADQAEFLINSVKFFKEKESFDMEEFANEVMSQPKIIEKFNKYKDDYLQERDIDIADNFTISDSAVKKQARAFKRVINLDKNIQIVIKGSRNQVEQGIDERGRKFYKIFYIEED